MFIRSIFLTVAIGKMITARRFSCSAAKSCLNQIFFVTSQCFSEENSDERLFLDEIVDNFFLREGTLIVPKLRLARINSARDHIPVLRTFLNEKAHPLYNVID